MTRWLGQRDDFRCASVALVNVMKWAGIKEYEGHRVNRKLAEGYLSDLCWTDRDGTFQFRFEPVLESIPGIAIQKHPQPTRWDVKGCLKSGGVVLLDSPWWDKRKRQRVGHYCLLVEVLAGGMFYYVINNIEGMSRTLVRGKKMAEMLRYPQALAYFIWKDTGWKD